ncbi:hypothetical protein HD806DRAFT_510802 [Xylariaceae sp. AK1471]|nr:hypothetical protein HD806DRAFT_510802 [Xylariaceae sp. AK1471]
MAGVRFVKFLRKLLQKGLQNETKNTSDIISFLQRSRDPDTGKGLGPKEIGTIVIVSGKSFLHWLLRL